MRCVYCLLVAPHEVVLLVLQQSGLALLLLAPSRRGGLVDLVQQGGLGGLGSGLEPGLLLEQGCLGDLLLQGRLGDLLLQGGLGDLLLQLGYPGRLPRPAVRGGDQSAGLSARSHPGARPWGGGGGEGGGGVMAEWRGTLLLLLARLSIQVDWQPLMLWLLAGLLLLLHRCVAHTRPLLLLLCWASLLLLLLLLQ